MNDNLATEKAHTDFPPTENFHKTRTHFIHKVLHIQHSVHAWLLNIWANLIMFSVTNNSAALSALINMFYHTSIHSADLPTNQHRK